MSFRIAAFASSAQQNVQEEEVSSSGLSQSQDREVGQGKMGEAGETPWQRPRVQYVELDDDEEMEMVLGMGDDKKATVNLNQMNNNSREAKEEKKEDLKKVFPTEQMHGNLPRALETGAGARVRIKGKKQFFYCDLCRVQLSSEETMISHVSGTPHRKKLRVEEEAHRAKIRAGLIPEEEPLPEFVKQIPVPTSAKTKIPKRLHERIREAEDPIIGLQFITEYLPESDPQMEPHYECGGKIYFNPLSNLNSHKLPSQIYFPSDGFVSLSLKCTHPFTLLA